jgi:predicted dehydrogenase
LLDLALWLAEFPDPVRVSAHMERGGGAKAVEDSMLVQLETSQGLGISIDVTWSYIGLEQKWWFSLLASRGSAQLGPLRVVKELNGRPAVVSPTGASARESAFTQSYRAELAHFLAIIADEAEYDPPDDQVRLQRVVEAIYKSADEGKEVRL